MKKWFKKYRVRIRNSILGLVIIGLITIIILVVYGYLNSLGENFFPNKRDELGQLGDYFGGALNPIFGLATFVALLITIVYQAKELNASTKELKNSATALAAQNKAIELQSFEQTFFSWLNIYRSLLDSIEYLDGHGKKDGRQALIQFQKKYIQSLSVGIIAEINDDGNELAIKIKGNWEALYINQESQLDSLFRSL